MAVERTLILLGTVFILLGIALIIIPILVRFIPRVDLEAIPWFILYVYRRGGFVFATSPILIVLSIAYFIWRILSR